MAGVFLSAEVVQGNMQGMNPYAYVGGNPETRNDPTGQMYAVPGGGGGRQVTVQQQQGYDYVYATSRALAPSGLPIMLDMYFHNHEVWTQTESYAEYTLHTSTRMLMAVEASALLRANVNWNATPQMQLLFYRAQRARAATGNRRLWTGHARE